MAVWDMQERLMCDGLTGFFTALSFAWGVNDGIQKDGSFERDLPSESVPLMLLTEVTLEAPVDWKDRWCVCV